MEVKRESFESESLHERIQDQQQQKTLRVKQEIMMKMMMSYSVLGVETSLDSCIIDDETAGLLFDEALAATTTAEAIDPN